MANEVALTGLEFIDDKGERVSVAEGDKISEYSIPKEDLELFKETGSIGEPVMTQSDKDAEKDELLEQIAQLQRDLAEAQNAQKAPATPNAPATKTTGK